MKIALVAATKINRVGMAVESNGQWWPHEDDDDASALSEFAGRQCYESWNRPNPKTATNAGYIGNIIDQMHTSVLEHGSVSVRVSDVSRSLTNQLVRHRHGSYSQLSQRFVPVNPDTPDDGYVVHPFWVGDTEANKVMSAAWSRAVQDYDRLYTMAITTLLANVPERKARKIASEAARMVLPNMTPTAIVVTGNHLYWRHFLDKRGGVDADAEIREMAVHMFTILTDLEPALYQDFHRLIRNVGDMAVTTVERVSA